MKTASHARKSPYELAKEVYRTEDCPRTLDEDIVHHVANGWVLSRPDILLLARPIDSHARREFIVDPSHVFRGYCDCWHIYLLCGDPSVAFKFEPIPLPFYSWERANILQFHPREDVIRHESLLTPADCRGHVLLQGWHAKTPNPSAATCPSHRG
jgi:hypothetical protein